MVHCHDHHKWNTKEQGLVVYFAGRGWSKGQREYYSGRTPPVRLQLSGLYSGYHWQEYVCVRLSELGSMLTSLFPVLQHQL
jgi:hypothetical protein